MEELYTRWGRELDREHVLEEYPRPQMVRETYVNLNGTWKYAITEQEKFPTDYDGDILVPFSPEAILSGVGRQLLPGEYLWYERRVSVDVQKLHNHQRLLLHFGAVDERCKIYVDGHLVGEHHIGYLSFTVDITEAVKGEVFTLQVCVQDDSDTSYHARGKQKLQRKGMYYTAQSGIWQSVWMEYVPETYIESFRVCSGSEQDTLAFIVLSEDNGKTGQIEIFEPDIYREYEKAEELEWPQVMTQQHNKLYVESFVPNQEREIKVPNPRYWTPETPYLYPIAISLGEDKVWGYVALRYFTIEKDEQNYPRICLNHNPIYQRGVLDQGYWPDGLYTAPSDEALIYDIETMQSLGYNMLRKHCKLEPDRWYYHCDRMGVMVWQDMVNGGSTYKDWYITYLATAYSFIHVKPKDTNHRLLSRTDIEGQQEFEEMMEGIVSALYNHPSISTWVLFNEGWGQFKTAELTEKLKQLDPHRLVDAASGWYDQGCGDFNSIHNYFFPLKIKAEKERATIVSEFGGYSMEIPGHIYGDGLYGYGTYKNLTELQKAYEDRDNQIDELRKKGLCASVYTQVSDIEDEVNGIMTYDREVIKLKAKGKVL